MSDLVLECRGVHRSFHDGRRELHVLRGADLEVAAGESVAIVGPSGTGKSTLLHIIGTLDRPTQGEVFFSGQAVKAMSRREINRLRNEGLGFVFQFYHLLPEFTALENVMMPGLCQGKPRKECLARAQELVRLVDLSDRENHKPGQLSGGEQQRIAIARALFNRPRLLLADEPTGNLDVDTGRGIIGLLWDLNRQEGVTLILVTHDEKVATEAHRVVELRNGAIRAR